jgi:flagellar biosynthesis protein FlhF
VHVSTPAAAENGIPVSDPIPLLRYGLADSGVDGDLADRLLVAAQNVLTPVAPAVALAAAFDGVFRFRPLTTGDGTGLLPGNARRKLMLVGPPGAGKTVTAAKLAARAQASSFSVRTATIDTRKTGGAAHLEALAAHLTIGTNIAQSPAELEALASGSRSDFTIIDSFGVNPFDADDMDELGAYIEAAHAEPIIILPAGIEASDAREMVARFVGLGCRRAIVTRIDLTRRLGSLLTAFNDNRVDFCDVSVSPDILPPAHGGLRPLNPVALARLVLPDPGLVRPEELPPEPKRKSAPVIKAWNPAS